MDSLEEVQELQGHTDRAWHLSWSPSGVLLASCSGDRTVRIWAEDPDTGRWACSAVLDDSHTRTVRCCAWCPSGRFLATASFDATTAIFEKQADEWAQVAALEGHENEVKCVAWSPSGTLLATCGRDKTVWVWEALPGHDFECVDVKYGHAQDVKSVAWHPSEEVLVSTSYDDTIKLWADEDGEWNCQQTLAGPCSGHTATVWGVTFSPDGALMASCSDDTTVRIWECHFARGFREPKWRLQTTISGHHSMSVFSVSWSRDNLIATGSRDNSIRVFRQAQGSATDDASSAPTYELSAARDEAHAGDVNCVAWRPKGGLLASAGDDGAVKLWAIRPANPPVGVT